MPIKTKTSSDIGGGQTGCSLSSVKADFSPSYSIQGCPQVHNHFLLPHTSQYTQSFQFSLKCLTLNMNGPPRKTEHLRKTSNMKET